MEKVKYVLNSLLTELGMGLGEYMLTGVGGLIFGVLAVFGLSGGGRDQEILAFWFLAIIAIIPILIGLIKTLKNGDHQSKLFALVDHALVFLVMRFIATLLVPVVIILVVLFVVAKVFLGVGVSDALQSFDSTSEPEPETKKEVKVWRGEGLGKEYLKVNSTGDMYFDPEDGEWHKIPEK